jgi:hypothetical protein
VIADDADSTGFTMPGYAKAAMAFTFHPVEDGTLVDTETRVLTTDSQSRRAFGGYWLLVRLGSGLIRRELLWAMRRRTHPS